MTTSPPTDVYAAPIDTPPVDSIVDASGHLLTLPDGYRWAGVLWRPNSEDGHTIEHGVRCVFLTVDLRNSASITNATGEERPLDQFDPHRYFRFLTIRRLPEDDLVWEANWLPKAAIHAFPEFDSTQVVIRGDHDYAPNIDTRLRTIYAGPTACRLFGQFTPYEKAAT